MDNPFAKIGIDYTQNKMKEIMGDQNWLTKFVFNDTLKHYYDVDQKFILKKFLFILFPFIKSNKKEVLDQGKEIPLSQAELYIPTLALISFVLIVCLN